MVRAEEEPDVGSGVQRDRRDGSVIANAWSSWIVVDLKRGRPVRLDRALPDRYFEMAEDTGGEVADGLPGALRDFDAEASFRTRRSELDLNGHTNHTVYFDWVLECAPDEIAVESYPVLLDAEFLASAKRESVAVRTKKISGSRARYDHSVILSATGEEAARISVTWAKI
jgi:acyl-ACP thioesterase